MFHQYLCSFRKKTLLIYLGLFLACLAIFFSILEHIVFSLAKDSLQNRVHFLIHQIRKASDEDHLIAILDSEKSFVFFRITLFDLDQKPLYDTHFSIPFNEQLFEANQPEVLEAAKYGQGVQNRYSSVFQQSMIYSATAFVFQGHDYILRIGLPYSQIRTLAHHYEGAFLGMGVIFFLLFGGMIWIVIHRFARPIQKIINAIQPFQEGKQDFIPRIEMGNEIQEKNEFGQLAQVYNALNERIQKQIFYLIEQKERTHEILESLGEGVIAIDIHDTIIFANLTAAQMLGFSGTLIHEQFSLIQPRRSDLLHQCRELLQSAREKMEIMTQTVSIEEKQKIYFELTAVPQPKHCNMILVLQDKTSDYEVIEMGKDFIANASHELRTPITIIRGFAETLNDLPNLTSTQLKEITEKIVKTSLRLDRLIKSLLALADIENIQEEHFQWADLSTIAEHCKKTLLITHPNIQIMIHHKTDRSSIWGDSDLIMMAVMNLLENAVKYSPAPATITLTLEREKEELQLTVTDRGIGIPETDLSHIFDRFYTVDKARSRKFGGSGLGLSIVKSIIQKHRGSVSVVSSMGEGTSFTLHFPASAHQ